MMSESVNRVKKAMLMLTSEEALQQAQAEGLARAGAGWRGLARAG